MSKALSLFFDAWQIESADRRRELIEKAVSPDIRYDDPRTSHSINGVAALCNYVGMFSANAPGWSAKVVDTSATAGMVRATVAFGGPGPDGSDMVQLGQYFAEFTDDQISRLVGFAGTGAAD